MIIVTWPPNLAMNDDSNPAQSYSQSGAQKLYLRCMPANSPVKTANPAESGPRSVMPINIGIANSPSRSRSSGFFNNNPTIPHIRLYLNSIFTAEAQRRGEKDTQR